MRKIVSGKIYFFLLLGMLFFAAAAGTASAFDLAGYTYNEIKGPLGNTTVLIEEYSFGQGGPPALNATYTNTSNGSGYFNIADIPDKPWMNYKIILRHFNATTGSLDYIGQSLPALPFFEISRLAQGPPIDFYLRAGGTINITATNGTAPQNFRYMIKDTRLGYPVAENFSSEVPNATIYVPASRNYSIEIYPNQSFPVSYDLNNLTTYTNYYANISFNTSNTLRKVSGYAKLPNGSSNFSDLKIIAYLMEPGSMVFQDYPLPYNMSSWCSPGCEGDTYNATNGSYSITLPGAAMTANILLFAAANGSNYYGAFRNISLNYSNDPVNNFNFSLQTLLGDVTNISVTNAGGGPGGPPGTTDITTKKLSFWLRNSSGVNITNAHIEVKVNYSVYGGSAFSWMADISQSSNGTFSIPALDSDISKINIFTQGSAPLKTSKKAAQLATSPVSINLSAFNPGAINESEGPPPVFIDMLKNTPQCDVPYPSQQDCSLFPQQQNMTDFNPFKIVIGGGKISLRMRSNFNNITVHYKNVDMLASGPPDALFDSNATQSQNGSAMEHARRFGSMGPEIYDEVLIGIPLALGINPNNVSIKFGKLYNESWGEVWNSSSGNTTADLPSDYSAFNLSFFGPGGMQCSTSNQNAPCYVNIADRMVWLTIPHFSGVDTTVSGTSGNFTATLNSTALAGNKANLNFTMNDTANTTSWYNITFQSGAGFDASTATANFTINGTLNPGVWQNTTGSSFVNVTSTSAADANSSTDQYINISNITVPSTAGNYTINVTTSNSLTVSLNYTVTTYGVNLTNTTALAQTAIVGTNASYTMVLQNNGSTTDTYNLTIDNPDAASVAAFNVSGNITLASNAAQTVVLNVSNTSAGTFRVNVTARSNNDSTKLGYINTTTIVSTDIASCANISLAGTYTLTQSITDSALTSCINVKSSNVIFDGNGYTIDGINITADTYGVYVYNSSTTLTNVTIKNVTISDWNKGIYYNNTQNGSIENNNASLNSFGIHLWISSNNNNLTNNIVNSNTFGIVVQSSTNNNLTNNIVNSNNWGIFLWNSSNNDLANNTANLSYKGIVLSESNNNILNNNTAKNSVLWDFSSDTNSSNNTVTNLSINYTISFTGKDISIRSASSPSNDPSGYRNISKYVNATNTSADSWLFLNVSYSADDAAGVNETLLRMWRYNGSTWSRAGGKNDVDASQNYVYANITSFSIFAPMAGSYGVNLSTVSSLSQTTTAGTNTTYILNLTNNGTEADTYILAIDNATSATTAALNISSTLTLNAGSTRMINLNVTNLISGAFRVNVTARSNNESTKFSYINTTTTVNPAPIGATITSPSNNSANTTGYVNITVTLNITGMAVLNWEGTNESMLPEGTGTSFYNNKSINLSGNYSFKVYANSTDGATNVSETRIIIANVTAITNLSSFVDATTGNTTQQVNISAPSRNVTVTIFNGTNATVNGTPVANISVDSLKLVNATYTFSDSSKFIGENLTLGPDGARFSPDVQIRFNYTSAQLTAAGFAESELAVEFYNTSTNAWEALTIYERNTTADYVIANTSHFSTFALIGVPTTTTPTSSSSGGGGGGGGGGGASGENFSNIVLKEKYDMHIYKDKTTSYAFTNSSNPVRFVDITGNVNAGEINTAVEVLKGTSTLVKERAPGAVYRNINIWVGTTGFAVSKNIKTATIKFRVENSWIADNSITGNDVSLFKWKDSIWNKLETKETGKDDRYTFFEAKTDSFSSFAISGLKTEAVPGGTATATPGYKTERTPTPVQTEKAAGFEIIFSIIALCAVYLLWQKR